MLFKFKEFWYVNVFYYYKQYVISLTATNAALTAATHTL